MSQFNVRAPNQSDFDDVIDNLHTEIRVLRAKVEQLQKQIAARAVGTIQTTTKGGNTK